MKPTAPILLLTNFAGVTHGAVQHLGRLKLQCRHVVEVGKTQLCMSMCNGCPTPSVDMCEDIAVGCNTNEIWNLASGITIIKTGGQCYPNSPNSYFYKKSYDYTCCSCPPGYKPFTYFKNNDVNCDPMADCVGCTEPDETLVIPPNDYPKCVKKTTTSTTKLPTATPRPVPKNTCPSLTAYSDPAHLKGSQLVISTSFVPDVKQLISCLASTPKAGLKDLKKAALNIQSASRCSVSKGLTPAKGISDHQLGRAVDANLILPDGTACNRDCIALGYCAFHPARKSCVDLYKKYKPAKNAKNTWINGFLTCAGKNGLEVGANYLPAGDWNHFERDVKDPAAAFKSYQPQLKDFCLKKCGVEGAKKINPSMQACECPGYH